MQAVARWSYCMKMLFQFKTQVSSIETILIKFQCEDYGRSSLSDKFGIYQYLFNVQLNQYPGNRKCPVANYFSKITDSAAALSFKSIDSISFTIPGGPHT